MFSASPKVRATRALLACTCVLSLSGCADALYRLAESQDTSILNPDTPEGERQAPKYFKWVDDFVETASRTGVHPDKEAERYLRCGNASGANASRAACRPGMTPERPKEAKEKEADRFAEAECDSAVDVTAVRGCISNFADARATARRHADNDDQAAAFLKIGAALSDRLCLDWFDRLQMADTTLRHTSDGISSLGSFTTALLGVTNASGASVGAAAAFFGLTKQSVDSLGRNYIVAADLSSVKRAVQTYRAKYRREIEAGEGEWTFWSADSVLKAYHDTCNALSVRAFISKRLETYGVPPAPDPAIYAAAKARYLTDINGLLTSDGKRLVVDQLPLMVAYEFLPTSGAAVHPELKKRLQDFKLITESKPTVFENDAKKEEARKLMLTDGVLSVLEGEAGQLLATLAAQQTPAKRGGAALQTMLPTLTKLSTGGETLSEDEVVMLYILADPSLDAQVKRGIFAVRPALFEGSPPKPKWAKEQDGKSFRAAILAGDPSLSAQTYVAQRAAPLLAALKALDQGPAAVAEAAKSARAKVTQAASAEARGWIVPTSPVDHRPLNLPPPVSPAG